MGNSGRQLKLLSVNKKSNQSDIKGQSSSLTGDVHSLDESTPNERRRQLLGAIDGSATPNAAPDRVRAARDSVTFARWNNQHRGTKWLEYVSFSLLLQPSLWQVAERP